MQHLHYLLQRRHLQWLLLIVFSLSGLESRPQIHLNLGVEAAGQYSIIEPGIDLGDFRARSLPNPSASFLGQFLFPNGFGLETGLRASHRDYWFNRKGTQRGIADEPREINQTVYGIPFTLVKQASGKFKKATTWRFSLGTEVNWYRLEYQPPDDRSIFWSDPVVSITAGGGLQYDCFILELSGAYAIDGAPSYPYATSIGIQDPIAPRFHVIQLALKCYFFQLARGHQSWF